MKEQAKSSIEIVVTSDDPEALVEAARKLAGQLKKRDEATKTQVRRLFGTLRQIEMGWPREVKADDEGARQVQQERDDAYRELVLFGPRLAYQAERHEGLTPLAKVIQEGIRHVGKDRKKLQRLVQFFEATVAYYVAGPEKGGV